MPKYKITFISRKAQFINLARVFLFAIAGLWLFGGIGHTVDLFRFYNAESWPRVEAKIIESRVFIQGTGINICNAPKIKFMYNFKGKQLTSTHWGFSIFNCSSPAFATDLINRYRVGADVIAHVNPHTGIAVLETDPQPLWIVTLLGVVCCFIIWIIRPKNITP